MKTLVLNADGLPLSSIPLNAVDWKVSVCQVYEDVAEALEYYDEWEVHSAKLTFRVPSVIMLRDYINISRAVQYNRENILLRDDYTCQYCGENFHHNLDRLTIDHVVPRFYGGKSQWDNVVAACSTCNHKKAHYLNMKPNCGKPKKPSYYQLVDHAHKYPVHVPHRTWVTYCGWDEDKIIVK